MQKLTVAFDKDEAGAIYRELQALEAEKCYKFPVCSMNYQYYFSSHVQVPEGIAFGNLTYKYDMGFADWDIT